MIQHPNHSELVDVAISAYMSVVPTTPAIREVCRDDGIRQPTNDELCAILLEAHAFYKD